MKRTTFTALILPLALAAATYAQIAAPPAPPVQQVQAANASSTWVSSTTGNFGHWTTGAGQAVLLVPRQDMPGENIAELAADLDVMCAVADRLLGEAGIKTTSWGPHISGYRRSTRSLYLPGFGALFLVEVEFPLAASPTTERPGDTETSDAVWEEVRTGLRSQKTRGRSTGTSQIQYDDLKVQSLKRTLQRAMRHCANLRHLGPDEKVIALAMEAPRARSTTRYLVRQGDPLSAYNVIHGRGAGGPAHIVAMQTTKKEVDALAAAQLTPEDFQQRISILSYKLPALETDTVRQGSRYPTRPSVTVPVPSQ